MTTTTTYRTLFQDYLCAGLQLVLAQVQAAEPLVPDELRRQAWHLLSYAFESAAAWPLARDLLLALAPKLEQAGYRGEWVPYLTQGLALSEQLGDGLAAAELRLYIGQLHRLQSRWQAAKELLTGSAEAFAQLGEQRGQARALNQLAYLAWQQHQPDEVARLAHTALALLAEGDIERAMSLSALGLAAIEQHRWQEAEAHHRAALQIRTQHGDRRLMAWSLQNVGYALRGQGRHEETVAYFEEAIAVLTTVHDPAHCAIAQMNLGVTYSLMEASAKALELYLAAESTFRQVGDDFNLAKVLTSKGIDYWSLDAWQDAEHVFVESIDLFKKLSEESLYLNALNGLGITYLGQGLYDKALATFEAVRKDLPHIQDTSAYHLLAKVIPSQIAQALEQKGRAAGLTDPKIL